MLIDKAFGGVRHTRNVTFLIGKLCIFSGTLSETSPVDSLKHLGAEMLDFGCLWAAQLGQKWHPKSSKWVQRAQTKHLGRSLLRSWNRLGSKMTFGLIMDQIWDPLIFVISWWFWRPFGCQPGPIMVLHFSGLKFTNFVRWCPVPASTRLTTAKCQEGIKNRTERAL